MLGMQQQKERRLVRQLMKIVFDLDCIDGYPPVKREMLNAVRLDKNSFRIKNVPFFVEEVSYDDVVAASETENPEQFDFLFVEENSPYTSISIIILDETVSEDLKDLFNGLDCVMEYGEFGVYKVFAVAIPSSSPYFDVRKKLEMYEDSGRISFAELALAHETL